MIVHHVRFMLYLFIFFVIVGSTFIYFHWYKNKRSDLKNILNERIERLKQKFIRRVCIKWLLNKYI